MEDNKKARVLALYLPQFHPIPENDLWWGKGFTEWTNVGKAKKYFRNHYQPRVPADLGYYDLRLPETRQAQADMAKDHGIEGFIYWHYWFGNGKRLLERPFEEVLESGKPDFPFALAWANESWKGFAYGLKDRNVLIEQLYPGNDDNIAHFYKLLPALKDRRYITVDGKPLFMIFKPQQLPYPKQFIDLWQMLAKQNGINDGIYFVGHSQLDPDPWSLADYLVNGFDAVHYVQLSAFYKEQGLLIRGYKKLLSTYLRWTPRTVYYRDLVRYWSNNIGREETYIPSIIPGWDHSPRSGIEGLILHNSTPNLFKTHVKKVIESVKEKPLEKRLVIIKSWNEWAEGNYMEPDLKWGLQFLEVLKEELYNGL